MILRIGGVILGRGHKWNVLLLGDGKELPFDAASPTMSFNIEDRKIVKVYRERFSKDSTFIAPPESDVPDNLYSSDWKDVTKKYVRVTDVTLNIPKEIASKKSYVLIGTFNNSNWEPQFYTKISNRKATYHELGVNNVYIGMYISEGVIKTFGDPFKVDSLGKIKYLSGKKKLSDQVLFRKYPRNSWVMTYESSMLGGKFEYSKEENFSDAKLAFAITEVPDSVVKINLVPEKYRYIRYVFPDSQRVYIGEISFFKDHKIIEVEPVNSKVNNSLIKVNDLDLNTYYWGKKGETIVYDFGEPIVVESIQFAPRSDSNFIVEGNDYELCLWYNGRWVSLGVATASSSNLKFKNVPENALYVLHNLTKGREERIFTYEKGKQVWW